MPVAQRPAASAMARAEDNEHLVIGVTAPPQAEAGNSAWLSRALPGRSSP